MEKGSINMNINPSDQSIYVQTITEIKPRLIKSNYIYLMLYTQIIKESTCKISWFEKYFVDFAVAEWKQFFTLTKTSCLNTRLIEFQFTIVHRVHA